MGIVVRSLCTSDVYRDIHRQATCFISGVCYFNSWRTCVWPASRHALYVIRFDVRFSCFVFCGRFVFGEKNGHYERLEAIQKQMEDNGFFYIFFLRILPINFDFVSYAAGLSNVKALPYFAATAVGIIPGTIALNVLGASFLAGNLPAFFLVLALYIVFISLPFILRKKMQNLFQESN